MTETEIRDELLRLLGEIAPEADLAALPEDAPLRDELDLDSMDVQSLVVGLYETTGIDVPERDYSKLTTLRACVDYLAARPTGGAPAP